jgi:acetyl-CoA carboxylase carboxyl transferase subunit alpha
VNVRSNSHFESRQTGDLAARHRAETAIQDNARPAPVDRQLSPMRTYLDFEKPIAELESKVNDLKALEGDDNAVSIKDEVKKLEQKANQLLADTYAKLSPWQKALVARHAERPHCLDYIDALIEDFTPLAGDRYFAEDAAIVGGLGTFRGRAVMVIGHEKGSDTESRIRHNFGMAMPEGYRKAVRLMDMADKFSIPVVTLIDTAGAYPGIGAEERGQAEAIARSTDCCLKLGVPLIALVIGEGGSGGAVAIATANRILMLEHAIYTVASPEAAASILWRDSAKKIDAATNMKITAQDLLDLGVIDTIVAEPTGGAHRDRARMMRNAGEAIAKALTEFDGKSPADIRAQRHERFLSIGRSLKA